jgi:hypothetical protein
LMEIMLFMTIIFASQTNVNVNLVEDGLNLVLVLPVNLSRTDN